MNNNISISEKDFPGIFQAADEESICSQKRYLRVLSIFLSLLILGAIVDLLAGNSRLYALISGALFSGSLFLLVLMEFRHYDRTWYSARAVAESVKTRAWRYMMRTEPYQGEACDESSRTAFLDDLQEILDENRDVTKELSGESATYNAISKKIEAVRSLDIGERLSVYRKHRVENQRDWYCRKASFNRNQGRNWFICIVTANGIAVACALLRIAFPGWFYLPTGILAVCAASAISWIQAKRYKELSTSYALAAHEIAIILDKLPMIQSEDSLSKYVSDTENVFSREHVQWAARRDTQCRIGKSN